MYVYYDKTSIKGITPSKRLSWENKGYNILETNNNNLVNELLLGHKDIENYCVIDGKIKLKHCNDLPIFIDLLEISPLYTNSQDIDLLYNETNQTLSITNNFAWTIDLMLVITEPFTKDPVYVCQPKLTIHKQQVLDDVDLPKHKPMALFARVIKPNDCGKVITYSFERSK